MPKEPLLPPGLGSSLLVALVLAWASALCFLVALAALDPHPAGRFDLDAPSSR